MTITVESICVTPGPDGLDDRLYMSTVDHKGIRHIEFMRPLFGENDAITSSWFVDDSPGLGSLTLNSCTPVSDGGFPDHPGIVGTTTLTDPLP